MSSINNTEYLYANLPAWMHRDDIEGGLFLKRFLSAVGSELDGFDDALDNFYQKIDPATAPIEFIEWWLSGLFDWGWFPSWFTITQRRAFYAYITRHYARRGTLEGIHEFLAAFGLRCIVQAAGPAYDEQCYDEHVWTIDAPLGIVVMLFPEAPAVNEDLDYYEEAAYEEAVAAMPSQSIQRPDIDELLRFVQPLGNMIMMEYLQFETLPTGAGLVYGEGVYGEQIPG